MKYISTVVKAVLLIYGVLFCVFNTTLVSVKILPVKFERELPLFLPIMVGVIAGVLLVIWIHAGMRYKTGAEIKRLKKQLSEYEKEIKRVASVSLTDDSALKSVITDDEGKA